MNYHKALFSLTLSFLFICAPVYGMESTDIVTNFLSSLTSSASSIGEQTIIFFCGTEDITAVQDKFYKINEKSTISLCELLKTQKEIKIEKAKKPNHDQAQINKLKKTSSEKIKEFNDHIDILTQYIRKYDTSIKNTNDCKRIENLIKIKNFITNTPLENIDIEKLIPHITSIIKITNFRIEEIEKKELLSTSDLAPFVPQLTTNNPDNTNIDQNESLNISSIIPNDPSTNTIKSSSPQNIINIQQETTSIPEIITYISEQSWDNNIKIYCLQLLWLANKNNIDERKQCANTLEKYNSSPPRAIHEKWNIPIKYQFIISTENFKLFFNNTQCTDDMFKSFKISLDKQIQAIEKERKERKNELVQKLLSQLKKSKKKIEKNANEKISTSLKDAITHKNLLKNLLSISTSTKNKEAIQNNINDINKQLDLLKKNVEIISKYKNQPSTSIFLHETEILNKDLEALKQYQKNNAEASETISTIKDLLDKITIQEELIKKCIKEQGYFLQDSNHPIIELITTLSNNISFIDENNSLYTTTINTITTSIKEIVNYSTEQLEHIETQKSVLILIKSYLDKIAKIKSINDIDDMIDKRLIDLNNTVKKSIEEKKIDEIIERISKNIRHNYKNQFNHNDITSNNIQLAVNDINKLIEVLKNNPENTQIGKSLETLINLICSAIYHKSANECLDFCMHLADIKTNYSNITKDNTKLVKQINERLESEIKTACDMYNAAANPSHHSIFSQELKTLDEYHKKISQYQTKYKSESNNDLAEALKSLFQLQEKIKTQDELINNCCNLARTFLLKDYSPIISLITTLSDNISLIDENNSLYEKTINTITQSIEKIAKTYTTTIEVEINRCYVLSQIKESIKKTVKLCTSSQKLNILLSLANNKYNETINYIIGKNNETDNNFTNTIANLFTTMDKHYFDILNTFTNKLKIKEISGKFNLDYYTITSKNIEPATEDTLSLIKIIQKDPEDEHGFKLLDALIRKICNNDFSQKFANDELNLCIHLANIKAQCLKIVDQENKNPESINELIVIINTKLEDAINDMITYCTSGEDPSVCTTYEDIQKDLDSSINKYPDAKDVLNDIKTKLEPYKEKITENFNKKAEQLGPQVALAIKEKEEKEKAALNAAATQAQQNLKDIISKYNDPKCVNDEQIIYGFWASKYLKNFNDYEEIYGPYDKIGNDHNKTAFENFIKIINQIKTINEIIKLNNKKSVTQQNNVANYVDLIHQKIKQITATLPKKQSVYDNNNPLYKKIVDNISKLLRLLEEHTMTTEINQLNDIKNTLSCSFKGKNEDNLNKFYKIIDDIINKLQPITNIKQPNSINNISITRTNLNKSSTDNTLTKKDQHKQNLTNPNINQPMRSEKTPSSLIGNNTNFIEAVIPKKESAPDQQKSEKPTTKKTQESLQSSWTLFNNPITWIISLPFKIISWPFKMFFGLFA